MTTQTEIPTLEPAPPKAEPADGLTPEQRAHFEATALPLDLDAPWPFPSANVRTPEGKARAGAWARAWFERLMG